MADPINPADQNAAVVNIRSDAGSPGGGAQGSSGSAKSSPIKGLSGAQGEALAELTARLKSLSLAQKATLGAAGFFLLLVVLFASLSGGKDDYRILFSNIDEKDSAAIVASLQQMNMPYKFTEGGGAILVPAKTVYETRLRLAGQGLPKSGFVGFELLENQKLGTSQFVEQVNYQRGLEGELAKSISSLSSVKTARVHLAVPKQSAFVREQQRPTASVVLTLHPGRFLDQRQAISITHLVGSSVPNMGPQDVTILDADGNLLAPNPDRSALGVDASQLKYVQEMEAILSKRVASILEPITGKGNVKAQVTLDMDFNELARTQEAFGKNTAPNPGAIRSQQSIVAEGTTPSTGGIPGALTNQPPPNATAPIQKGANTAGNASRTLNAPGDGGGAATSRNELTTNYEVDRTIEYLKRAKGELRRVSAAVVVNYKSQTDSKSGDVKAVPYSQQELQQMIGLARDAVGFRQDRGDSVSVANIPFTPEPVDYLPFYKDPAVLELSKEIMKFGLIFAALAVLFLVVVKPILFPAAKPEEQVVEQNIEEEFDEKVKAELALLSPESRDKRRMELQLRREQQQLAEEERKRLEEEERQYAEEERKRKSEEAQREYEDLLVYAKDFIERDPRVVANVFKTWMTKDTKAGA